MPVGSSIRVSCLVLLVVVFATSWTVPPCRAASGGENRQRWQPSADDMRAFGEARLAALKAGLIDALQSNRIPPGLKYFYTVFCQDNPAHPSKERSSVCKNYDPQQATLVFWRSMKLDDVTSYSKRMSEYNRRFAPKDHPDSIAVPRELRACKSSSRKQLA
jgi:hypothetical protein